MSHNLLVLQKISTKNLQIIQRYNASPISFVKNTLKVLTESDFKKLNSLQQLGVRAILLGYFSNLK